MEEVKVQLTEEYKQKLKNVLGFTVNSTFKYVPIDFRLAENEIPKELWPVFTLKSKDGVEISQAEDNAGEMLYNDATKETKMKMKGGSQRLHALELGIKEIKNYPLENGAVLAYDKLKEQLTFKTPEGNEKITKGVKVLNVIRYFPATLQVELQNAINERKTLTSEELLGLE